MLALFLAVMLAAAYAGPAAAASQASHCSPGQAPQYIFGFKALHDALGPQMGVPLTCEFADPNGTGDVHQRTTEGVAFWRKSTNTPTFTNGYEHWAITDRGLVYWLGDSIDPLLADPSPSTNDSLESADVNPGPVAAYWLRSASFSDVAQTSDGVTLRITWAGITEVGRLATRASIVSRPDQQWVNDSGRHPGAGRKHFRHLGYIDPARRVQRVRVPAYDLDLQRGSNPSSRI